MEDEPLQEPAELLANPAQAVAWLEAQDPKLQKSLAVSLFERQLAAARQPRAVSGQACVKLCGLVEHLARAKSDELRLWALSREVCIKLFNFYVDWDESDHHRSMQLVLDVLVQNIKANPDREVAARTKRCLLDSLFAIVTGRSAKPLAKSAIKCLDQLLSKKVFTLTDICMGYKSHLKEPVPQSDSEIWRRFTTDTLNWMRLQFVCPTAGKFIVSVYRCWVHESDASQITCPSLDEWYEWLLEFASEDASLLESIKNYIFLPLFKADRDEGLRFLGKMSGQEAISTVSSQGTDTPALLQLAALETGKKIGLVEEPSISADKSQSGKSRTVVIQEKMLDDVLAHPSRDVRSLALSLLVTSPSTTRPFSSTTLDLLRKHLSAFFADSDAKFRVEVSGRVRDMFKRLRGAIHVLKRSIPRARAKAVKAELAGKNVMTGPDSVSNGSPIRYQSNLISLPDAELVTCLQYHEAFLVWYVRFLCRELIPTASYQRHIASLKAISSILRVEGESSKTWETPDDQGLFFDLFDDAWARALLDLVMDPFDDVRDVAAATLRKLFADSRYRKFALRGFVCRGKAADTVRRVLGRAERMARRTSRADHSDGVSRMMQLLYELLESGEERISLLSKLVSELERKTSMAESNLGGAVLEAPLHGDFASLNHIWKVIGTTKMAKADVEAINLLQERLVRYCERVWVAVMRVLCDDSPEGHLPQELEDVEGLETKSLLSFSFRAVYDSSNLMRIMVLAARNRRRDGFVSPTREVFERMGRLAFDQLSNLRHRGALTTVASTFATCCQQTKQLDHSEELLEIWYQGTLDCIESQVSTTRRSAGIPSMMTGLLSANAGRPSFQLAVETLFNIAGREARVSATDGSSLPQVHAFNCLKDMFKNSTLTSMGNKMEESLPQCLELAANGLRSEVWAIRNCGLLLLRSLVDCLFGSQESKAMIEAGWDGKANRIPYYRYPNLAVVLRSLLVSAHSMLAQQTATVSAAESVFPALDIVRRAGPPELIRDEIQDLVAAYLSSPVWHVRELSARTLCSCLLHAEWLSLVKRLVKDALADCSRNRLNHVHGALLSLKFLVERLSQVAAELLAAGLTDLVSFLDSQSMATRFPQCPHVTAAYLDVVNSIWAFEAANSAPQSPLQVTVHTSHKGSALLARSSLMHSVYATVVVANPVEPLRKLLMELKLDSESLSSALDALPGLLDIKATTDETLVGLGTLYMDICRETSFSEVKVRTTQNLADVMDQVLQRGQSELLSQDALLDWWSALSAKAMNPSLACAAIQASGRLVAILGLGKGSEVMDLRAWGRMMRDAGLDDKTLDTRLAAIDSLHALFAATGPNCTSDEHLAALLALYDALNDDDDELREASARAAACIIGQGVEPIEAANRLLVWMAKHFGDSAEFRTEVVARVAGCHGIVHNQTDHACDASWSPAKDQLTAALRFDDALFVVKEQNLFVDEVRETHRWVHVLQSLSWSKDATALLQLDGWLTAGVKHLGSLAEHVEDDADADDEHDARDGPLGWSSKPAVFAIATRLVRSSAALMEGGLASEALVEAATRAGEVLGREDGGVSRLLR